MVNTLLFIVSGLSFLLWLLQECWVRPQIQTNLQHCAEQKKTNWSADTLLINTIPAWSEWLYRGIFLLWCGWLVTVFLVKDGDFALILVWLTIYSGVVYAIDHFFFAAKRMRFLNQKAIQGLLSPYTGEGKERLLGNFSKELVLAEYAKSFFPVLFVVMVLRSFIVEPFQIPSASMVPTLKIGDYILVNKFTYGIRLPVVGTKIVDIDQPARGDVMVFFPPNDNRYFIKRVIGLPGDSIRYVNKQLIINDKPIEQAFLAKVTDQYSGRYVDLVEEQLGESKHLAHKTLGIDRGDFSYVVPEGHYFMMGDNRDNSSDSRVWGAVPEKNIVGKAFAKWMYWPSLGQLPSFSRAGLIH